MSRFASVPPPKVKNLDSRLSVAALNMPKSEGLRPELESHHVEASKAAISPSRAGGKVEQFRIAGVVAPLTRTPVPGLISDVAIADWEDLLGAVKERLRLTVGECPDPTPDLHVDDRARQVQASVLECALALDQLQTTLAHELGRRQQLEMEVFDARTALAQAHAELMGTQAEERRTRHLALHDALTSLPNRGFFGERLEHALALAAPQRHALAVLYLDLDGFKAINDTYGHAVGDELLRIVGARLSRGVRTEDMVSRFGGDEFACLLADSPDREHLSRLACKLIDAVQAPCKIGQLQLSVRPSIGIAICPSDGESAETLLKNADAAMCCAKRQQSGHAFFDQACGL